jgi:hypothetical protein
MLHRIEGQSPSIGTVVGLLVLAGWYWLDWLTNGL